MHQAKKIYIRHRKSRIKLKSFTQSTRTFPQNNNLQNARHQPFSALNHLWKEKYISFEDYATACYYIEFNGLMNTISGAPAGYQRRVSWQRPRDVSRISWIQADMASLDRQVSPHLSDEALLLQWKQLQHDLRSQGGPLKDVFQKLLFTDRPPQFSLRLRLYLKAFLELIPTVRLFFQHLYT